MENIKLFKNSFSQIYNQFEEITFEESIKFLMKKKTIEQTKNFLNSLQSFINYEKEIIPPKILLSAFFIYHFQEDVLSEKKNDIDCFIYQKSKFIVEITKKLSIQSKIEILKYISELNKYKHYFNQWKIKDLESQLQIYKQMYYDSNFNPNIKNKIEKLIGIEKTNELLIITESNIQKMLKNAFWDILKQDFKKENYYQISSLIKDIKFYFCNINPKLQTKLDDYLDNNLINIYIKIKNFELLFEIVKFCLIELKKLDAPFYDRKNSNLQNLVPNTDNFILILSFLLERLELISSLKK